MLGRVAQALTAVLILAFVGFVAIGKHESGEHVFRARIVTPATPESLFGALMDPAAVGAVAGDMPGYGRLLGISWSREPGRYARVTERYQKGAESYWIAAWDPPRVVEERYDLASLMGASDVDRRIFADFRQRWTMMREKGGGGTALELSQIMVPNGIDAGFLIRVDLEARRAEIEETLRKQAKALAKWAEGHPRTSVAEGLASVHVATSEAQMEPKASESAAPAQALGAGGRLDALQPGPAGRAKTSTVS